MNKIRFRLYHANTIGYDKIAFYLKYRLMTFYITSYLYIERYISIILNISRFTVYRKNMNLLNNYVLFNITKSTCQYL